MNRRDLLLATARTAILAAFGTITGARAQTPIVSRTVSPIPQGRIASPAAPDARNAPRTHNGKLMQSYAKTGGPYYQSGLAINMFKDASYFGRPERCDANGYIQDWTGLSDARSLIFLRQNWPGRYVIRGKGAAQISLAENFQGGVELIPPTTVPGTHAVSGHADYEWEVWSSVRSSYNQRDISTFYIRNGRNYPNHLRDLVLLHEGHIAAYDAGLRFEPKSIAALRKSVGYNRMLDNTSNFTFCATKTEWVPETSFTWHAWANPDHYAGRGTMDDLTHFTVPGAPVPFAENYQEHITLYFPRVSYSTLIVTNRVAVGNKTRVVIANSSNGPVSELAVGSRIRFDKYPTPSMDAYNRNRSDGFLINERTSPSGSIELLLDFDSSSDPPGLAQHGTRIYARAVPFLRIGNGRYIPINRIFGEQWYVPFVNDTNEVYILHYDKTRDGWDPNVFSGIENPCVVHPSVLLKMCHEIGCHPWFCTPWRAADAYVSSPTALPVKENMTDHVREYATVVRDYIDAHAPWMVPIFEPPNETWNFGFPSTQYSFRAAAMRGSSNYDQVSGDADQWYATVTSLIGQTIAEVFGVRENQVRTQNKYRMVSSYWTAVNMHEQITRDSNGNVTDFRAPERRFGRGDWFSLHGGSPAYKWCTDISYTTYYNPPLYDTLWERRMAEVWNEDRTPGGSYQYLVDFYASTEVNFPEPWQADKQYHGPRKDGTVDVVYDFEHGGQMYAYVALRDGIGVKPNTSCQAGYGGHGQNDPKNYWWRAQSGGRGGNFKQVYENAAFFAGNPQWGTIPGGGTGIGMMPYEGGWSPDFGGDARLNAFRRETNRATTLRQCAFHNYQLNHEAGLKYNVARGGGINPSEFSFAGNSIWSVWYGGLDTTFFDGMDPPLPPRWLAMLDWNAQTPPPPPSKEARHHLVSPKQTSPRAPAKVPQSVPSWCRGLHYPNLSVCEPGHGGQ